jgi:hypothetical protein
MATRTAFAFNLLWLAVSVGLVTVYPLLAIRTLRRHGAAALGRLLAGALGLVVAFALLASADRFGNALSGTYGYMAIAPSVVLTFLVQLGLPLTVASATAMLVDSRGASTVAAYVASATAAVVAWGASIFLLLLLRPVFEWLGRS